MSSDDHYLLCVWIVVNNRNAMTPLERDMGRAGL